MPDANASPLPHNAYSAGILTKGSWLTRFSHQKRFQSYRDMLRTQTFGVALDWGCADEALLKELLALNVIERGIGLDTSADQILTENQETRSPTLVRITEKDLLSHAPPGGFDIAFCTETLEHVNNRMHVIASIANVLKPRGVCVISVPIELGPALLIKQLGRRLANRTREYEYHRYSAWELFCSLLYKNIRRGRSGYKGFDYRDIRPELSRHFRVEKAAYTPIHALGPLLSSSVVFYCTKP